MKDPGGCKKMRKAGNQEMHAFPAFLLSSFLDAPMSHG
jgi:hypothetical protein